ncbi:MAG TPA: cytochrome P450 [Ilumatobacter sp.]|nr:cytochrome P450 [Ilumatobacter sp.]
MSTSQHTAKAVPTTTAALAELVDGWWMRTDPQATAHPWGVFERLRNEAPVYRHPSGSVVLVSRYADVNHVLFDSDHFSSDPHHLKVNKPAGPATEDPEIQRRTQLLEEILDFHYHFLSAFDDPHHTELRSLVNRAFTARAVNESAELIEALVDELLDAASAMGEFDIMDDFAWRLPLIVVTQMLGISREDCEEIHALSDDIGAFFGARSVGVGNEHLESAHASMLKLRAYLGNIFDHGNLDEMPSLMSVIVQGYRDHVELQTDLLALTYMLLFAGHETTARLLATGTHSLMEHRDQWDLLCERPDVMSSAVEELLRYESVAIGVSRYVVEPTVLCGVELHPGEWVRLLLGAGNHDPLQFEDPERLDLTRRGAKQLAFGMGQHFCLGAALARLEAAKGFGRLSARFPDLKIADPSSVTFNSSMQFRGIVNARVSVK